MFVCEAEESLIKHRILYWRDSPISCFYWKMLDGAANFQLFSMTRFSDKENVLFIQIYYFVWSSEKFA